MTVDEIIKNSLILLDEKDLAENFTTISVEDEGYEKVDRLLKCVNAMQDAIANSYSAPIKKQDICAKTLSYTELSGSPLYIVCAYDKFFRRVRYKEYLGYVEFQRKISHIEYAVRPSSVGISDDLEVKCSLEIATFGTLMEYFLRIGDYENAELYGERFNECALIFYSNKTGFRLPMQRWI